MGETKAETTRKKVFFDRWQYKDKEIVTQLSEVALSDTHSELIKLMMSCVSFTKTCKRLPRIDIPEKRMYTDDNIPDDMAQEAIKIYREVMKRTDDVSFISITGRVVALQRECASVCITCNYEHANENPFLIIDQSGTVLFNCRRHKDEFGELTKLCTPIGKIDIPVEEQISLQSVPEEVCFEGQAHLSLGDIYRLQPLDGPTRYDIVLSLQKQKKRVRRRN